MKNLNRRGFLRGTTKLALAGAVTAKIMKPSKAFAEGESGLEIESEISFNHGHELELTVPDLIARLRQTQVSEANTVISIQGQSHPHDIELSSDEMIALILGEEVTKASIGGSHSHDVIIKLNVN